MERLENSLRVKVTGACNRNCFFCHKEGGMNEIDEIQFTPEFGFLANRLFDEFNIQSIALTGGEPLLHQNLEAFVQTVARETKINKFSLTTNGTVFREKEFWASLIHCGLHKVNLSISDILDSVDATGSPVRKSVFDNQIETIVTLNELGITPNINVVVYNDEKYLINLLNILFAQNHAKYNIALLPDLTDGHTFERSQRVIREAIKYYGCKKIKASHRKGTSNTVCDYITNGGYQLQVKTTKLDGHPKWLDSLCSECSHRDHCQEGFYGLRVENRNNQLMIRLCLYKSDPSVLMGIEDFFASPVYTELKDLWC